MTYRACLPTCSPPMETGCERAGYRIGCINLELLTPCADSGGVVGSSMPIPNCQEGGVNRTLNNCTGLQLDGSAVYAFLWTRLTYGITAELLDTPIGLFFRCLIGDDLTAYIGKVLKLSLDWKWACRLDQTRFVLKVTGPFLGSALGTVLFWGEGYVDGSVWHTAPVDVEFTGLNGSRDANVRISVPSPCPVCEDPDACLDDAATGGVPLDFTFDPDPDKCSLWDAPLGPHTITAGSLWVYEADATHYISKMRLILDNLSPGINARLKILYSDDLENFEANGIEYEAIVDGECIDGQFFGTATFQSPMCGDPGPGADPVLIIDFVGPV